MFCCIDSLTLENFQMADGVWNCPIMHCKPLVIDYVIYALIVCIVLLTWKQLFIPDLRISIWWPDIRNYYLLAPFLKKWPLNKVFRGHFWPSSKIFWLKHCQGCLAPILEHTWLVTMSHREGLDSSKMAFINLVQAPVVQRLDNAVHRINRYPADKCWQNKPCYPMDSDLSIG